MIDGSRLPLVEDIAWGRSQTQKDVKPASGIHPSLKPTSASAAAQRKISEDDDDASDSEKKMVICEDEPAGNQSSVIV